MASQLNAFSTNIQFSEYFFSLDGPTKHRYCEKVNEIGFDPYALKKSDFSEDFAMIPRLEYPDIGLCPGVPVNQNMSWCAG